MPNQPSTYFIPPTPDRKLTSIEKILGNMGLDLEYFHVKWSSKFSMPDDWLFFVAHVNEVQLIWNKTLRRWPVDRIKANKIKFGREVGYCKERLEEYRGLTIRFRLSELEDDYLEILEGSRGIELEPWHIDLLQSWRFRRARLEWGLALMSMYSPGDEKGKDLCSSHFIISTYTMSE